MEWDNLVAKAEMLLDLGTQRAIDATSAKEARIAEVILFACQTLMNYSHMVMVEDGPDSH